MPQLSGVMTNAREVAQQRCAAQDDTGATAWAPCGRSLRHRDAVSAAHERSRRALTVAGKHLGAVALGHDRPLLQKNGPLAKALNLFFGVTDQNHRAISG